MHNECGWDDNNEYFIFNRFKISLFNVKRISYLRLNNIEIDIKLEFEGIAFDT